MNRIFMMILILIVAVSSLVAADVPTTGDVTVSLNMGADANKYLGVWFTSSDISTMSEPENSAITPETSVTLLRDVDNTTSFVANNDDDPLFITVKSNGYSDALVRIWCEKDLTSDSSGAPTISWQASAGDAKVVSKGNDVGTKGIVAEDISTNGQSFVESYAVNISTVNVPTAATGNYSAKLYCEIVSAGADGREG